MTIVVIREVPLRLEHLALGPFFEQGGYPGDGPGRSVWPYLWTYRQALPREVFPGDQALATQTGLSVRQVQDGLRALESRGALERIKRVRGRSKRPKRVLRLKPHVLPYSRAQFDLESCANVRALCRLVRKRPHVDIAVLLGLLILAREIESRRWPRGYSPPFWATPSCLSHLVGTSRNTPRRSISRLVDVGLLQARSQDGDWADGISVATPNLWRHLLVDGRARLLVKPAAHLAGPPDDPWFDAPPAESFDPANFEPVP